MILLSIRTNLLSPIGVQAYTLLQYNVLSAPSLCFLYII